MDSQYTNPGDIDARLDCQRSRDRNALLLAADATRTAILDAVVRCFAVQGWAGTNMSLVARETGMTRGKIQYYFPVLEDLKYAAIEYLYECWRSSYFGRIDPDATPRLQLDMGVNLLWRQANNEPLHVAMVELESAARTDERLRAMLAQLHISDEQALDQARPLLRDDLHQRPRRPYLPARCCALAGEADRCAQGMHRCVLAEPGHARLGRKHARQGQDKRRRWHSACRPSA